MENLNRKKPLVDEKSNHYKNRLYNREEKGGVIKISKIRKASKILTQQSSKAFINKMKQISHEIGNMICA